MAAAATFAKRHVKNPRFLSYESTSAAIFGCPLEKWDGFFGLF
jgi:hypothetical protein